MAKRPPRIAPTSSPDGFSARQRKYGAKLAHWFPDVGPDERIVAVLPIEASAFDERNMLGRDRAVQTPVQTSQPEKPD